MNLRGFILGWPGCQTWGTSVVANFWLQTDSNSYATENCRTGDQNHTIGTWWNSRVECVMKTWKKEMVLVEVLMNTCHPVSQRVSSLRTIVFRPRSPQTCTWSIITPSPHPTFKNSRWWLAFHLSRKAGGLCWLNGWLCFFMVFVHLIFTHLFTSVGTPLNKIPRKKMPGSAARIATREQAPYLNSKLSDIGGAKPMSATSIRCIHMGWVLPSKSSHLFIVGTIIFTIHFGIPLLLETSIYGGDPNYLQVLGWSMTLKKPYKNRGIWGPKVPGLGQSRSLPELHHRNQRVTVGHHGWSLW